MRAATGERAVALARVGAPDAGVAVEGAGQDQGASAESQSQASSGHVQTISTYF